MTSNDEYQPPTLGVSSTKYTYLRLDPNYPKTYSSGYDFYMSGDTFDNSYLNQWLIDKGASTSPYIPPNDVSTSIYTYLRLDPSYNEDSDYTDFLSNDLKNYNIWISNPDTEAAYTPKDTTDFQNGLVYYFDNGNTEAAITLTIIYGNDLSLVGEFQDSDRLNLISTWITSKVTNMSNAFKGGSSPGGHND